METYCRPVDRRLALPVVGALPLTTAAAAAKATGASKGSFSKNEE